VHQSTVGAVPDGPRGRPRKRPVERDVGAEAQLLFHLDGGGRLVGVSGVGPTALARDLRVGQIMIERVWLYDPAALADPRPG